MKKLGLIVLISILPLFLLAGKSHTGFRPIHAFDGAFSEAYHTYPNIPAGILEAFAWHESRMQHLESGSEHASCMGIPQKYGIMGLMDDPTGTFRSTLQVLSDWSGIPKEVLKNDSKKQIMTWAAYLSAQMHSINYPARKQEAILADIILRMSDIPAQAGDTRNNFALHSQVYATLTFLNDPDMQAAYRLPTRTLDLEKHFGTENYRVLSASHVQIAGANIRAANGATWTSLPTGTTSPDYPSALWDPAATCNYSSRSGTAVSAVTIHTVQGSYAGAINWFKNCAASVSAHYVIRSFDGQVTQMVLESNKAWHVGTENPYTIGIEHEGYVADASWYTNAMYLSSADLVKDIINSGYGINPLRTWYGPSTSGLQTLSTNCYKIKGHQHYPNQTHVDPGINWDWDRFYRLINGDIPASATTMTACSGNIYDSGGSGSNYGNQERKAWIIAPTGATTATLTFTAFSTEAGYDYLYVYAGNSPEGDLLGKFDGNTIPGPFTSHSGKFYLEFRSDCATTGTGWAASYSCSTAPAACGSPTNLTETNRYGGGVTLGWNAVTGASSYEVRVRHSLSNAWTTYAASGNSLQLSGLAAQSLYYWQVRTLCGANASTFVGDSLHTPSWANTTLSQCAGILNDAGGTVGGYRNNENYTVTISPAGASNVTVNFTAFETEANYDFLRIYDGANTSAPLIGTYSGTTSPGTVTSSGGSITIKFTSDNWTTKSGWQANWTCAANLAPNTAIIPPPLWVTDDFVASFTDTDHSGTGLKDRYYQVLEYDGTEWGANRGNGFLYELFDGGFPHWTMTSGNYYILNDRLHQTDTTTTNTNVHIDVAQNNSGSWLYSFSARLWPGATNRRFGIHLFADSPTLANRGNSYLIWFRGDNQTLEIYETVNDVLNRMVIEPLTIGDYVWNEYKVVYDPGTGKIEVFQENDLVGSWTDPTPITAGGYVSLRTNQAHMDFETLRLFKERSATANILVGPANTDDVRYQSPNPATDAGQVHSIVRDNLDQWSNMDFKSFKVDWTIPDAITAAEGPSADIDTTFSTTDLDMNWTGSTDPNSDIARYWYALGTAPGLTDVIGWTDAGDTLLASLGGLSLVHNTLYYVSARAENGAGLLSVVASGDGVRVWAPVVGVAPATDFGFELWPNPAQERVQLALPRWGNHQVSVWNMEGKCLWQAVLNGDHAEWQVAEWPKGVYVVRVIREDGEVATRRLTVD